LASLSLYSRVEEEHVREISSTVGEVREIAWFSVVIMSMVGRSFLPP